MNTNAEILKHNITDMVTLPVPDDVKAVFLIASLFDDAANLVETKTTIKEAVDALREISAQVQGRKS